MNPTFSHLDHFLYRVNIDATQIKQELPDQPWRKEEPYWRADENLERYHLEKHDAVTGTPKICLDYFHSTEHKSRLLDLLFASEKFNMLWGWPNRTEFEKVTTVYSKFVLDKPGYYTDFHADSHKQIAFGMIYFIEGDDPSQSTYFYSDKLKQQTTRIPTGMGQGWLVINNNDAWHEGGNKSTQDRYCLQFGLNFNF